MVESAPKPIVVFDGDCGFCRKQIVRIQRMDRWDRFAYTPRQEPGLEERFPQLADGDFDTGMRLIDPDGTIHVGADAIYRIVRQTPYWRRAAWLYRVPLLHSALSAAYAWVAANRQRLGGACADGACADGACAIESEPSPDRSRNPAAETGES